MYLWVAHVHPPGIILRTASLRPLQTVRVRLVETATAHPSRHVDPDPSQL